MALVWSDFRAQVRRSVLYDDAGDNFSDGQLLDAVEWALNAFCAHTALPKTTFWSSDVVKTAPDTMYDMTADRAFALPDDVFDNIEQSGLVYIVRNGSAYYLNPAPYTPGLHRFHANPAYFRWPDDTLNVVAGMEESDAIYLRYFAYYPIPADDDDVIPIPQWSRMAVAYLTGAYALGSAATDEAGLARWKDKQSLGQPEVNSLRKQQEHLVKMYERELLRHPQQDRLNAFREPS